jgi:hypothetical protein
MSIKLAILKSGETVISDAKELIVEDKVCGYLFNNPHRVEYRKPILLSEEKQLPEGEVQITLSPWIILTSDTQVPLPSDWIVTLVEPLSSVKEMYLERVGEEDD